MMAMHRLRIKRVYDAPAATDGVRVLVDRLWPRGLNKDQARVDHWLKEIAPSSELRQWYGHDDARWDEFKRRYFEELATSDQPVKSLRELLLGKTVTLLYSTRSDAHNNAIALAEFILGE